MLFIILYSKLFFIEGMRFFCVKQIYPNGKCDDMVKIILQTPPEIRTDEDHNKVFACFHHDVYLNTI